MGNIKYKPVFLSILICFLLAVNRPSVAYEYKSPLRKAPFQPAENNPQQAPPVPGGEGGVPAGGLERDNPVAVGNGLGLLLGMSIAYGWFLFSKRKKETCKF